MVKKLKLTIGWQDLGADSGWGWRLERFDEDVDGEGSGEWESAGSGGSKGEAGEDAEVGEALEDLDTRHRQFGVEDFDPTPNGGWVAVIGV